MEQLLTAARLAALEQGLAELIRIHVRLGPESGIGGDELIAVLQKRFRGPLLGRCQVSWEPAESGGLALARIEGYPARRTFG